MESHTEEAASNLNILEKSQQCSFDENKNRCEKSNDTAPLERRFA
jgi:hypothetical protein